MNHLPLMECNGKSSLQWDWESLIMFNAAANEIPRKLQQTEWELDGAGGVGSSSLCSSGFAEGSGGSVSDWGPTTLSKSSKSGSNNSSSVEVKTSKFTLEASEGIPKDFSSNEEFTKTFEASVASGEPLLGLKLGKRTYFEDICPSNAKSSTLSVNLASSVAPLKRSKSISQSLQTPRCQVEGCNLDLSSAKDYHRKHRVCASHSKCPKVVVAGVERRFCQQCSRFHGLSEFDEKKRSCRRRLGDHNARRRKPQPETLQLNPSRIYDEKQQMGLVWNRFSLIHSRAEEKFQWESIDSEKTTQTKGLKINPTKYEANDGQMLFDNNRLSNSVTPTHPDAGGILLSKAKVTTANAFHKDIEEFTISSNFNGTQDFHRALSLLSTPSWGSCEPKHVSLNNDHPESALQSDLVSDYWRNEQPDTLTSNRDGHNQFQEFQLFRAPYDSYFCPSQLN